MCCDCSAARSRDEPDRFSTLVNIVAQRIAGEEVVYFRPELASGPGDSSQIAR